MKFIDPKLEAYAIRNSRPVPEIFEALRQYTETNTNLPQMMVGPIEGNFLKVLARLVYARRILEVGTFTGYSGLMMASALPDDGHLYTCELSEEHANIARRFFDMSPHKDKITIQRGPAADSIKALDGPFDMAFIDADKVNYTNYFELIRPKMRPGGLIVADNVLWSGSVLKDPAQMDESTKGIVQFNEHIRQLADLDKVMLTVRDGMFLIVV